MKTILVATDFSTSAMNAANYASDMAIAIEAKVLFLHISHLPVNYGEIPLSVNEESLKNDAEKEMIHLKDEINRRTAGKLNIETEVTSGIFFQELEAVCKRINPYTVIMGSQGTTVAERLLLGGHTVNAMKHLMWPLITIPPGVQFSSIKKIGLACDFENVEETIPVDEIKQIVHDYDAELHLLNTGKKEIFNADLVFESGILRNKLEELKPAYHFITSNNIDEGILDFAKINNIDLLIVLPKRHGLFERLTHKSLTKQMVLHSPVPVMALH